MAVGKQKKGEEGQGEREKKRDGKGNEERRSRRSRPGGKIQFQEHTP
jgi:hypothetical protein